MTATSKTPIWLLDVDGVINALPHRFGGERGGLPVEQGWDDYRIGYALPDVVYNAASKNRPRDGYRITYSPTLLKRIRELHESGAVEVRWLTTWGAGANGQLRALLDLPEFVVAGDPDEISDWSTVSRPDDRSAWWKFFHAIAAHEAEPDRPIIWTDDDLCHVRAACDWANEVGVLAISTNDLVGITPLDLERIEQFIAEKSAVTT